MIKILHDMMSRQNLEKGATIEEHTVWGYGLGKNESGFFPDILIPKTELLLLLTK